MSTFKPMTVKQLRARLARYSDDALVVNQVGDGIRSCRNEKWEMGTGYTRTICKRVTLRGW